MAGRATFTRAGREGERGASRHTEVFLEPSRFPAGRQLGVGHSEARGEASKCEFWSFALEIFRAFRNELFLNASEKWRSISLGFLL